MVEIYKIAHLFGQLAPFGRELHHVFTTFSVVVLCRDIFFRVLVVDIFLGDTKFFLYANLDWKSVSIPTGFAFHLESLHGLVAVEGVLDGTCKHMVDAGMAVGRGRTLEEDVLWTSLSFIDCLVEDVVFLPLSKYLLIRFSEV